jgi:hypothetical protein
MPHKLGTAWTAEDVVSERLAIMHARACPRVDFTWSSYI